ncbi:MAG: hypothetical protein AAGA92_02170 [Planctomycetota bacterium]
MHTNRKLKALMLAGGATALAGFGFFWRHQTPGMVLVGVGFVVYTIARSIEWWGEGSDED